MRLVGIFGGTFNPIHYGHLHMAQALADALTMDEVKFIPSANPPHKDHVTVAAEHRAAMVNLAIAKNPLFSIDELERNRAGVSYTIDTLISLRQSSGKETALCLMMGSDVFINLDTWHRWQELLEYVHIILVKRPGKPQQAFPNQLQTLMHDHYTENRSELSRNHAGLINMQAISALDISATQIRAHLKHGLSVKHLLPEEVAIYIQQHHLYQ